MTEAAQLSLSEIESLIQNRYRLGTVRSITPVPRGRSGNNYRVVTSQGTCFFTEFQTKRTLPTLRYQHQVMRYLARQDIPVPHIYTTAEGEDIIAQNGRYCALYSYAPGRPVPQHELTPAQIQATGALLGRVHAALARFDGYAPLEVWDTADKIRLCDHLLQRIAAKPDRGAFDAFADAALQERRQALAMTDPEAFSRFAATCPVQPLHGDFYPDNLHFDGTRVVALLDFEQCHTRYFRTWELMRAMLLFSPTDFREDLSHALRFLKAYLAVNPIPPAELRQMPVIYTLHMRHSLWGIREHYLARMVDQPALDALAMQRHAQWRWLEQNAERLGASLLQGLES